MWIGKRLAWISDRLVLSDRLLWVGSCDSARALRVSARTDALAWTRSHGPVTSRDEHVLLCVQLRVVPACKCHGLFVAAPLRTQTCCDTG